MFVSYVSSKGLITIPQEIREMLNLSEGDGAVFLNKDGQLAIKKDDEKVQMKKAE